ncbi:hypothetical protein [Streptomyces sp. STCH 565 A]|uniref:hypothetical protein n=1 Tax=Streptomyces sp. STCH 565 A TaxID=2950532 RepID=UPI002074BF4E|nr:hypothetical protein [Streptomyces sp. STCH 565 A]MCM8548880.1 hypothetical protein [Streptomyces sp. STCH 565 A]
MKTDLTATRELAAGLRRQAARTGSTTPSVRGADWRLATVSAVGGDGTVTADGIAVRRLETYLNPAVGDVIVLTQSSSGNWLALGRTATDAGTAWTSYTPTWTASTTNPNLGNGTLVGRYHKVGRTVHLHINLTAGSTTTYGSGTYSFALPVQAANAGCTYVGDAHLLQVSRWGGQFLISPGATSATPAWTSSSSNAGLSLWTSSQAPVSMASGGIVRITITYESAI